ncbi:pyridoxal phosphate-dependent aminotransferase [Agriterribacter sp.]|uniref:pyridoxal phosphate-dependent aminotransferase n=1 Tax=Agriterribacter sp. TaxID=2821509 RepID=UPI002C699D7B|nr:aminotransferase class I/II-fold pyridoxal phosphate-dependent enzyme [Agriterribacter sp.]HTN07270.1 aminotransferase class I/II-fold pyridoxal phosphate-dependent enzyme [Agriterribacter sp.]
MFISKEVQPSATLKFSQKAKEKIAKGEIIYSLGLGEPDFDPPVELIESVSAAAKNGFNKYGNSMGLDSLRLHIAQKLQNENGIPCEKDDICITFGAKQALILALMAILQPGDEVINISPCYVSYVPQIKIAEPNAIIKNVDLCRGDFSLDFQMIEAAISGKTKCIILNSPNNPSGKVFTRAEFDQLISLLSDSEIYLISDEIYEYLNFGQYGMISPGSYNEVAGRVFTINGFSKSFGMTGWRIGYMAVPKKQRKSISTLVQHINTNVTSFIQKGLEGIYNIDRGYLNSYNMHLRKMAGYITDELNAAGLQVIKPQGGLFCFVNVSAKGLKSDDFAAGLLDEQNVAVTPGIAFGENWDDYVRISFAGKEKEIRSGIEGIKKFLQ